MDTFTLLAIVIVLTVIFDYINGFHDSANAIATVVSTRVLTPGVAVVFGAILNFAGALMGTEVAATIGKGLVDIEAVSLQTVFCTVLSAIIWNLITWYKGLPTSSSHAIIGSLLGATFFGAVDGIDHIHFDTLVKKVILPMILSPVFGIIAGFAIMTLLTWMIYKISLGRINRIFGKLQIVSAGFMALNHGLNDAQKSMGIMALALALAYPGSEFVIPLWVKLICAVAMGLGTMSGGWRIIRTLGSKMIRLQPVHGFAAETTASLLIGGASHFGIPLSTTQVITTSILGVGTATRPEGVRWGVVSNIVWAWVLTLPLTFLMAGAIRKLFALYVFS